MDAHTNTASATARLIAHSLVWLSRDERRGRFVPPRVAQLTYALVEGDEDTDWRYRLLHHAETRPAIAFAERLALPGIQLHWAVRKLFLEEAACDALTANAEQIVIIGAGLDTLALRLHKEFTSCRFIEIDHPATQRAKLESLNRIKATQEVAPAANLHFLSADLATQPLDEVLLESGFFRRNVKSLFVAEGVLMYLEMLDVKELFAAVRRLSGAGSRFAWTFMETLDEGGIAFRNSTSLINRWLRGRGEKFKSSFARKEIEPFLHTHDFKLRETVCAETLRRRYLAPAGLEFLALAEGECIVIAET
ncbi:MAG: SAM-dependent methyltransferase [Pyrinomonadaceae bacterium]